MKLLSTFVLLAALSVFVEAASLHDHVHRSNHHSISRRASNKTRRCKQRPPQVNSDPKTDTSTSDPKSSGQPAKDDSNNGSQPANNDPKNNTPNSGNTSGVIQVQDYRCGPNGATEDVTQTTGPNGSIDWLNCGIENGGWNPPFLHIGDLITVDLDTAIAQGGPFTACEPYAWAFKQSADQYGLPSILLASIALQESSCNPDTVGGNGEQGLMQLTKDKCGNAPGGNCRDVGYNVWTGAKYFSDSLAENGGNFLLTLGRYNGWEPGMDIGYATRMRYTQCHAQNNLDYLFQTCNGWLLNKDAYQLHLGKYHNLDGC